MKFLEKVKSSKVFKKTLAFIASASIAMSAFAINAFAVEGSGSTGVDYSSISTSLISGFSEIVNQCIAMATSIVPLGLGIMGLGKMLSVAKKFFTKATN